MWCCLGATYFCNFLPFVGVCVYLELYRGYMVDVLLQLKKSLLVFCDERTKYCITEARIHYKFSWFLNITTEFRCEGLDHCQRHYKPTIITAACLVMLSELSPACCLEQEQSAIYYCPYLALLSSFMALGIWQIKLRHGHVLELIHDTHEFNTSFVILRIMFRLSTKTWSR